MSRFSYSTNMIFRGDNLEILNELKKTYFNKVKCIYIDPPYNTGADHKYYADARSSEEWISFMTKRLLILRDLLSDDGSIWISINDFELHNLITTTEHIFGKENHLATITWQHKIKEHNSNTKFQLDHSYILCFQKSDKFSFPPGIKPKTVWLENETGNQFEAFQESFALFGENMFSTPKPEKLIRKILELSTKEGDLVLDCFAGSGTTGAVAQKLQRHWILMELGEHCKTHILKRMSQIASQIVPSEDTSQTALSGFCFFNDVSEYRRYANHVF